MGLHKVLSCVLCCFIGLSGTSAIPTETNSGSEVPTSTVSPPDTCAPNYFLCDSVCVSEHWRCDGIHDCQDGVDEADCNELSPETVENFSLPSSNLLLKSVAISTISPPHTCSPNNFMCDQACVSENWRCDGTVDCQDGVDEADCSEPSPDTGENRPIPPSKSDCPADRVLCDGMCHPGSWRCDGLKDCEDGKDEHQCENDMDNEVVFRRQKCPEDFELVEGICILEHTTLKSWKEAKDTCLKRRSRLAQFTTNTWDSVLQFLENKYGLNGSKYWIGRPETMPYYDIIEKTLKTPTTWPFNIFKMKNSVRNSPHKKCFFIDKNWKIYFTRDCNAHAGFICELLGD